MPRHVYTPQGGFLTYSSTPATWNTTVNNAVNAVTAGADGLFTLLKEKVVRSKLDDLHFRTAPLGGKKYRAIALCDSEMWYRINYLLTTFYTYARERGEKNPLFDVDYQLVFDGILYLNVPNLKKFRLAYDGTAGYPSIGPGMTSDPRSYTPTATISPIIYLGQNAIIEGYNDAMSVTKEEGKHEKGLEVASHIQEGFVRGEWYSKDGTTGANSVYCDNMLVTLWYEPGVGSTGWA